MTVTSTKATLPPRVRQSHKAENTSNEASGLMQP